MLKREAEFSSHTVALPLLSLSGAAHFQNAARAVWRGHTHTHTHTHTLSHASPPHPRRGVSSTAGALPLLRQFRGTSVSKTHFHLKKERCRGLLIGLNFAHQMFPSVYSGTGCDYPVITHTAPNKELPGFSPALLDHRTSAAHRSRKLGWKKKKEKKNPFWAEPPSFPRSCRAAPAAPASPPGCGARPTPTPKTGRRAPLHHHHPRTDTHTEPRVPWEPMSRSKPEGRYAKG